MLKYLLSSATEETRKFLNSLAEIISTGNALTLSASIWEATEITSSVSSAKIEGIAKIKMRIVFKNL